MSTRLFYRTACVLVVLLAVAVAGYAQQTASATITGLNAYWPGTTAPGGAAVTAGMDFFDLVIDGTNLGYSTSFSVQWTSGNTGLTTSLETLSAGASITAMVPPDLVTVEDNVQIRILYNSTELTDPFDFRVNPPMTEVTLPNGVAGVPYSAPIVTGGTPPYNYGDSSLPSGFTIDSASGNLVGTPTSPGTFPFVAYIWDGWSNVSSSGVLVIQPPPPQITVAPVAYGMVSQAYSQAFSATGGVGEPYMWSIASGALPPGLSLDPQSGTLTGTPLSGGNFNVVIQVMDSMSGIGLRAVTITIFDVGPATLPNATVGTAYSQAFTPVGGVSPYSFHEFLTSPNGPTTTVPPGLTLSSSGILSGTPTATGTFNINLQVTDGQGRVFIKVISIVVGPAALTITTASPLPGGTVGTPYSVAFVATGAASAITWTISSGTLPPGLTLASNGLLSGTPTSAATAAFTVRAATGTSPAAAIQSATKSFALSVADNVSALEVTTVSLPEATYQISYSAGFTAAGGKPPYSWSIAGLPAGLAAGADGTISGTPTEIGTFRVAATVADADERTTGRYYTLVVKAPPLLISTISPLTEMKLGIPATQAFSATGGVAPYSWGISGGSVPQGVRFSAGMLSGTPSAVGEFQFIVQVRDSKDTITNKSFSLKVVPDLLTITTRTLPEGRVGEAYSASVVASGGAPPYHWAISAGAAGLSGDSAGNIAGTPTAAGTSTVTAEVTDSKGAKASASFELGISGAALRITTAGLPDGTVGSAYSAAFAATGGTPPYRWAAVAGYAAGLALSSDGALTGTPGDAGDYTVYVEVTDSQGLKQSRAFSFRVSQASLSITTASLPGGTVGAAYSAGLTATGNSGPVTWTIGGLPDGLTGVPDGSISGTPRAPGTISVTLEASDGAGHHATRTVSLAIGLPAIPGVTIGAPETANPAQQPALQLGLEGTYPLTISGIVTLTFAADGGGDDPTIVFSNGSRTVAFTIPAGTNLATFAVPNLALQTGTVSGTITLRVTLQASGTDITPSPAPSRTIRVNRMPPVITRVTAARTATGFNVTVTGYSTTREISEAIFRFAPAAGTTITSAEVSVPVQSMFTTWYNNPDSRAYGSQFTFTQPFTINGESTSVIGVSAILVNTAGRSESVSATMP
ncbi:MAG TPA: putative Ig domain-containing protein [Bryobacteraceae bacterium]|nr:putative Ig domain-containing protein [Bryobacteraceae bacterium]